MNGRIAYVVQRPWFPAILLASMTLLLYGRSVTFDFVNFDDPAYVYENPDLQRGLSFEGLRYAFTTPEVGNYGPIVLISFLAEYELAGYDPRVYHATNAVFHIANAVLLLLILSRLTGQRWRAFVVAALFAVHPLHVESVAWVSERKDVLSAFFWVLAMGAYVGYARKLTSARYVLVAASLLMSLLAKPMAVTLPFALLLLDFWPLRRARLVRGDLRRWGGLFVEKLPLLMVAVLFSALAVFTQRSAGALSDVHAPPIGERILNALASYGTYLFQTVWPFGLAVFYPPLPQDLLWKRAAIGAIAVIVITITAIAARRRHPYALAGWLWYLGVLVPVIGLVQVGAQAHADRYMYLPQIGLFIAIVWTAANLLSLVPWRRAARFGLALGACVACVAISWRQLEYWRSSQTLFAHALDVTTGNARAHDYYGQALLEAGYTEEAIVQFSQAIRFESGNPQPRYNLAVAYRDLGDHRRAQEEALEAVNIAPEYAPALFMLGTLALNDGRLPEAIGYYERAVAVRPDYVDALINLGVAQAQAQRLDEAERALERAVQLEPSNAQAHYNLARVLLLRRERRRAMTHLREALRLEPGHQQAERALSDLEGAKTP